MVISVRSPGRRRGRADKEGRPRGTARTEAVLPALVFPVQKIFLFLSEPVPPPLLPCTQVEAEGSDSVIPRALPLQTTLAIFLAAA